MSRKPTLVTLCLLYVASMGVSAALLLSACANDPVVDTDLGRWELPRANAENIFIEHKTDDGLTNYCLEYNLEANHCQWVAYRYDRALASRSHRGRTEAWQPEPALDGIREHQVAAGYFPRYTRGHLVGSAERYYSRQANEQTFYMANISPMNREFNGTYWGCVEDLARDRWARSIGERDTMYIVKGGTLDRTLGTIDVKNTLGKTVKMVVPKFFFMAVLWLRDGEMQAIGFWMEHKDYKNTSKEFLGNLARQSACTIDELEERTGLDFFHNLPDDLEAKVEKSCNPSFWPGI